MNDLQRGVVSITPTKRRRFWWVAWWTAEPQREPFRPPDAFEGGARSRDEAKRAAERAAGRPLAEIEAKWARAWVRVRAGQAPWPAGRARGDDPARPRPSPPMPTARSILGVAADATEEEIKRAFHALALATHPDRGGDAASFMRVKSAYDALRGGRSRRRR
jgi:hypothetical protein